MAEADDLVARVQAFVDEYAKRRGLDPEVVMTLGNAGDGLPLNLSDLRALLASRIASQKAPQPAPVQQALTERQIVQCLVASS